MKGPRVTFVFMKEHLNLESLVNTGIACKVHTSEKEDLLSLAKSTWTQSTVPGSCWLPGVDQSNQRASLYSVFVGSPRFR